MSIQDQKKGDGNRARDKASPRFSGEDKYLKRFLICILLSILLNAGIIVSLPLVSSINSALEKAATQNRKKEDRIEMVLMKKPQKPEVQHPKDQIRQKPVDDLQNIMSDPRLGSKEAPNNPSYQSDQNVLAMQTKPSANINGIPYSEGKNSFNDNILEKDPTAKKWTNPEEKLAFKESTGKDEKTQQAQPEIKTESKTSPKAAEGSFKESKQSIKLPETKDLALLDNRPLLKQGNEGEQERPSNTQQKPQPALPEKLAAQGNDKDSHVLPVSSKSALDGGVSRVGKVLSFDTISTEWGTYIKKPNLKVAAYWNYLLQEKYMGQKGVVVVGFTLLANGEIQNVKVVETNMNLILTAACVEAIQKASPFAPIPESVRALKGNNIELTWGFYFD